MGAAVHEQLRDFDFVGAADRWLGRDHAEVVLAFLELPFPSGSFARVGQGEHDRLVVGRFFDRGGLLNDLEGFLGCRCGRFLDLGDCLSRLDSLLNGGLRDRLRSLFLREGHGNKNADAE